MIKSIKNGLHERKARVFLIFLTCSFLAWLVSRLSETYTSNASFDLEYTNVPDSLVLTGASRDEIDVRVRASGFQFLGFNFRNKSVSIDLSKVGQRQSRFFVAQDVFRKQIEKQLSGSMSLLEVDTDTLYFDFYNVYRKEVPVKPNIGITLSQNHLLEGTLKLEPGTITIKGPKNEIDTVQELTTLKMTLTEIGEDFSTRMSLYKPESMKYTTFSTNSVQVSGKVFRFSEQLIGVPVVVDQYS